jgi:hypothetical protein
VGEEHWATARAVPARTGGAMKTAIADLFGIDRPILAFALLTLHVLAPSVEAIGKLRTVQGDGLRPHLLFEHLSDEVELH